MSAIDRAWLEERIGVAKDHIKAIEAAMLAVAGGAVSYSLDSGQTRQSVTKATPGELSNALAKAEGRLAALNARLCGGGVNVIPGF